MKKIFFIGAFSFMSILGINAQSFPTSLPANTEELKKEAEAIKSDPKTVTKAVEVVKTNVTTANATKVLSLIKTKVTVTPDQESKILGLVSKIEVNKDSTPTSQLKKLMGNVNFTKIFSSTQLAKLKSLITKK